MRAQLSLFGVEAPRTDGLFFAVFPDDKAPLQLAQITQQLCIWHRLDAKPLATERFHVSLLGLGEHDGLPQHFVAVARGAAATIAMASFDVTFDRALSFSRRTRMSRQ